MYKVNRIYKKAQFTLEYTILIAVAIGALLTMQVYLKRAIQGRLKEGGDQLGHEYFPEGKILRDVHSGYHNVIEEYDIEHQEGNSSRDETMIWYDPDEEE